MQKQAYWWHKVQPRKTTIKACFYMANTWPLHGQYFRELDAPYINKGLSLAWMHKSGLNGAAEATTFAIQEQAITTSYIERNIYNSYNIDDKCRLCGAFLKTIHHIVSGCPTLASTKYTWRHNNVANLLYIRLATKFQLLQEKALWYPYDPPPILENDNAKILWNFSLQTDHQIAHNKPDIILHDNNDNSVLIIGIAIPNDYNVIHNLRNYTDLAVELKTLR